MSVLDIILVIILSIIGVVVLFLCIGAFICGLDGNLAEYHRANKRRKKRYKPQYPTRRMYDNFYRTGNFRYLYDKNFKGR